MKKILLLSLMVLGSIFQTFASEKKSELRDSIALLNQKIEMLSKQVDHLQEKSKRDSLNVVRLELNLSKYEELRKYMKGSLQSAQNYLNENKGLLEDLLKMSKEVINEEAFYNMINRIGEEVEKSSEKWILEIEEKSLISRLTRMFSHVR